LDIEKIATSCIKMLLSRSPYLQPIIDDNDKTPVWDGDIFVYNTKDRYKKNENLIGRVPVQVKGHEVEKVDNNDKIETIKFRVKIEDIKKFLTDGGVIYFVVHLDKNNQKIFYNSLLPLDLSRLIKTYSDQKTFMLEFKTLPLEEKDLADIFLDFIRNREKQQGTLVTDILYTHDIEKIRDEIEGFSFSYSTVEPSKSIPFRELTTRDFYIYAKPKGIGNPIPIEKVTNATIDFEEKFKISIGEKLYYNDAYIQWKEGRANIICGKAIKINMGETNDQNIGTFNINIKFKGTLNEQLNDLYFLEGLITNKQLIIDGHMIPYGNFKLNDEDRNLFDRIKQLESLKQCLEYYGVKIDLDLDSITEKDDFKITFLMDKKPSTKKYKIDLSNVGILGLDIANIRILLFVEENKEGEFYKVKSFFKGTWKVNYILYENNEKIRVSQFLTLDKESLLVDNINSESIIADIKKYHSGNKNLEFVNLFLLESIKAYDEYSSQQIELKNLIYDLSRWLYNESKEDYIFLNLAQIKYRMGTLDKYDIDKIIDIGKLNKDNIEIQVGVSILLNKKEDAEALIKNMNPELKDLFISYPIYHLLENCDIQNI